MNIVTFRTEDLKEYFRNPRKNDDVVHKMVSCINEFGFRIPIIAKSDGSVVDGHLRLKAARQLGMTEVPVIIADDLSDAQIKAFRLVANRSVNWAEWDDELLALEFEELKNLNFDLDFTGFNLNEIEKYLNKNISIAEDDIDEEIINPEDAKIVSKPGDLWILGENRLLCGDSTKINDVEKLMNGQLADMVFCDPPYNVKVSTISGVGKRKSEKNHDEFAMASGEMTESEFIDFLTTVFSNLVLYSKNGSIHFHCMDWKHIYEIMVAGRSSYTELKQVCVWNKDNGGMGTFYRSKHELIFVFKNGTAQHKNTFELGQYGRNRTNVWDYAGINSIKTQFRDEYLKMHPTVKPVALVADAILDCSITGDLIVDLFGGSGSTMIACEETNRKCYMMEYEPKYIDTIIRRWQKHTGKAAVLKSTGQTFDDLEDESHAANN